MYNIVCVKYGTKYGPEYVNRLFYGVRKNLTLPFKFHCFTENPTGIDDNIKIHNLPHTLPGKGWWQKLYLFSDQISLKGKIFYIDLDTLVTGNIDKIVKHSGDKLTVLHDFFNYRAGNKEAVGSGLMSWKAGQYTHIWDTFIKNPQKAMDKIHPHGDQKWVEINEPNRNYFQELFPKQIVSYKVHCKKRLPDNARIVCYHGAPSIEQSINETVVAQNCTYRPAEWVKRFWCDEP